MIWTATQSRLAIQFYAMNKVWTSFNSLERSNNRPQNATRRCEGDCVVTKAVELGKLGRQGATC